MRTDRLTLARAFEDAGVERDKAEHVADVVFDAIRRTWRPRSISLPPGQKWNKRGSHSMRASTWWSAA